MENPGFVDTGMIVMFTDVGSRKLIRGKIFHESRANTHDLKVVIFLVTQNINLKHLCRYKIQFYNPITTLGTAALIPDSPYIVYKQDVS
jgi:hypothetical protein